MGGLGLVFDDFPAEVGLGGCGGTHFGRFVPGGDGGEGIASRVPCPFANNVMGCGHFRGILRLCGSVFVRKASHCYWGRGVRDWSRPRSGPRCSIVRGVRHMERCAEWCALLQSWGNRMPKFSHAFPTPFHRFFIRPSEPPHAPPSASHRIVARRSGFSHMPWRECYGYVPRA